MNFIKNLSTKLPLNLTHLKFGIGGILISSEALKLEVKEKVQVVTKCKGVILTYYVVYKKDESFIYFLALTNNRLNLGKVKWHVTV